ncbi:MAG: 4Fe-4S dicluster domain-containing protein, partial [Planctomycetota bacterium]
GQHDGVVAVPLGYGRQGTDRFVDVGPAWIEARPTVAKGGTVGTNAAPLLALEDGLLRYACPGIRVEKTGRKQDLARSQLYQSLDVPEDLTPAEEQRRSIVQRTTHEAWRQDPASGRFEVHEATELWDDDHVYSGSHWGLAVDLTACTGCSACVVACQAENNIPVVGKDEVRRLRDLYWMRIDRYVQEEADGVEVHHMPVMCQQCDHAPCETVCPVMATVHDSGGLNVQIYNRCVGTRYCANNCPYKVRRFNWFSYMRDERLENLALNPDVTVRVRGVMEKCSFCIQRIAEAQAEARARGGTVADGEIVPACAQVCPADAIVFGDTNDPESRVSGRQGDPRAYRLLEELNVRPSVSYLTVVRNRREERGGATHG